MKPKILIVAEDGLAKNLPHFMINLSYGEAVSKAGGLPIVAINGNCLDDYVDMCDGLLLTDGPFVHVGSYGEIYDPEKEMPELSRKREVMEFYLCKKMIESKKPVLGINRGMNLINVILGGSLEDNGELQRINNLAQGLVAVSLSQNGDIVEFHHESQNIFGKKCSPDKLDEKIFNGFIKGAVR